MGVGFGKPMSVSFFPSNSSSRLIFVLGTQHLTT